jgi:selenocysteine-specific elongation factor
MAPLKNVIVGTAGHIDHGKSALVQALTGTDPDRLAEEKRRGITIDLGFAFLQIEDVRFGFVDVPGHERFIRNMLAGAGGVDIVMLVIAADESIKPQTREHFDICRLLGISNGLIALTKIDLVDSDVASLALLEAEDFVRDSFLQGAPIVPVSARTGAGLDHLKSELLRVARSVPARNPRKYFRLPIDRAFARKGFGAVVTGTLVSGTVAPNDVAELFPARKRVRIRGVHSAGQSVPCAAAGQRTALNLAGIELADLARGMVLAAPDSFRVTQWLDARLTILPGARPLKNHARIHFHQGAAEAIAEVVLLEGRRNGDATGNDVRKTASADVLAPGESALAQLRLDVPLLLLPGDRFIIRQLSPVATIGGGVVLDALARRHRLNDPPALAFLQTLESGSPVDILLALAKSQPAGLDLTRIVARTGWMESEIRAAAEILARDNKIRVISGQPFLIVSSAAFDWLTGSVLQQLDSFHRSNPLAPGLSREDLRARLGRVAQPEIFHHALDHLAAQHKIALSGDLIIRAGHAVALLPEETQAKALIVREFERAGLTAPRLAEVLADLPVENVRARKIVQILLRENVLVKVIPDLLFHAAALARLRGLLADYRLVQGDRISVSAFKDLAGISRKYAIPLLEYLDRQGLTRRAGDERVIL